MTMGRRSSSLALSNRRCLLTVEGEWSSSELFRRLLPRNDDDDDDDDDDVDHVETEIFFKRTSDESISAVMGPEKLSLDSRAHLNIDRLAAELKFIDRIADALFISVGSADF